MFETVSAPSVSRPRDARLLRLAMGRPPGAATLLLLEQIDVSALSAADRVDLMKCWDAHEGWLLARRAAAVVSVAGTTPQPCTVGGILLETEFAEESMRSEVSAALRITPTSAGMRIATARFVVAHPEVHASLASGAMGFGHLAVLERELSASSAAATDAVLSRVLPSVGGQTPSRLRQHVRRALAAVDAEAIRRRVAANARRRSCDLSPEPDLGARMSVTGPWSMLAWAHRQFDAWARLERERRRHAAASGRGPAVDDPGLDPALDPDADTSLSALRADALVEAARLLATAMGDPGTDRIGADPVDQARASAGAAPEPTRRRAGVVPRGRSWSTAVVVCDLPTALGLADEPGFVPGYGFVPAPIARELLATAQTWRRFLTDSGRLVDAGATTYRPSDRLRELVTARDQTCVFPTCTVPAIVADLDHTVAFDGTNTRAANLRPLCRRHHRMKTHHPRWRVQQDVDGQTRWTAPSGHTYRGSPHPLWQRDVSRDPDAASRSRTGPPPPTAESPVEAAFDALLAS